jgi:enoyl-CoA hydratase/carnithine racemase
MCSSRAPTALVNHLVPREAVLGTAIDIARRLAAVPTESFAASKEGIARSFDAEFDIAFADAANYQSQLQERGVVAALRRNTRPPSSERL